MDTLTFLSTILPEVGYKYAAVWRDKPNHERKGFFIHQAFAEIEELAEFIQQMIAKGRTVYHACATYKEIKYKEVSADFTVVVGRKQDNVAFAKSLWLDLDVKAGSYETQRDAARDMIRLAKTLGVHTPMLVSSGYGVHVYFPLDQVVSADTWHALANKLRAVVDHLGILHDPSRTCDSASVLRPVGSVNRKTTEGKPVRLIAGCEPYSLHALEAALDGYIDTHGLAFDVLAGRRQPELVSDLISHVEYPPSHADEMVKHCQQVAAFAASGGASEPVWYQMLGLVKHCEDGERVAHEWSTKHPEYDAELTQRKLEQWTFGPPTCAHIRKIDASGCAGCEKTCTSPIQLGFRGFEESKPHTPIEAVADERPIDEVEFGPGSQFWPKGYAVMNGSVYYDNKNEDGEHKPVQLCTACWVVSEVESKGEYLLHMRAEIRNGKAHDFDIPMSAVSSADKLKSALASNRVLVHDHSGKAGIKLMDLIIKQSAAIQRHREEIRTFTQMGWNNTKDRFLMGSTLFTDTGRTSVRVSSDLSKLCKGANTIVGDLPSRGSIEDYKAAVTTLYGNPGQEACRYVLGASIGAYLAPLVDDDSWHGIPLSVYSARSGYGKTTLVAIGLNAVAKHTQLMASDATLNGLKKILSAYGSVPVLFDELTGKLATPQISDLLYNWSQGIDRVRLRPDGTLMPGNEPWCNMGFVTTNSSVLFKLTESPTDPEACQIRVMEIDLSAHISKPSKTTQALAINTATNVYGVATDKLLHVLLRNRDKIRDQLHQEFLAVTDALPPKQAVTSRFLAHHAACTVVGIKIGRNLGLWDFSAAEARKFAVAHITSQIEQVSDYRASPEDRFASMLADLHGRLIITYRFDSIDGRAKAEEPLTTVPSTQSVAGRYAIGAPATKENPADPGRLFVTIHAINDWCESRGLNALEVRKEWMDAGLIEMRKGAGRLGEQKVSLGKGIPAKGLGQARCLEFSIHKVRGVLPEVDIRPVTATEPTAATA